MNDSMGVIVNRHTVKMERMLPGPIDKVWDYFTDSDRIEEWLMPGRVEKELGGLIEFTSPPVPKDFVEGVIEHSEDVFSCGMVSEFDPPRVLAYSWNEFIYDSASEFKIELEEKDGQVHLVLTHSHLDAEWMAVTATGWHTSLMTLIAILKGEEKPDITPSFNKLLEDYKVVLASAGVVVVATTASPAMASELSDQAYKQVKSQKHSLLVKYDSLWKDAKHLKDDIRRLERAANRDNKAIDALYRDLKYKKQDMHKIEQDVRDLDKVLS